MISAIPIVVSSLSSIEQEVIASLARASGNITGIAIDFGPDFYSKQLDLLLEAAPKVSHVAFLGAERTYRGMRQLWSEAKQRGVGIQEFLYSHNYEALFSSMVREAQPQFSSWQMPSKFLTPIGLHDWRDSIGCLS